MHRHDDPYPRRNVLPAPFLSSPGQSGEAATPQRTPCLSVPAAPCLTPIGRAWPRQPHLTSGTTPMLSPPCLSRPAVPNRTNASRRCAYPALRLFEACEALPHHTSRAEAPPAKANRTLPRDASPAKERPAPRRLSREEWPRHTTPSLTRVSTPLNTARSGGQRVVLILHDIERAKTDTG